MLVGADGAHSMMRRSFLKRPMTNFSQTYIDHGYMELRIAPNENGKVKTYKKEYGSFGNIRIFS